MDKKMTTIWISEKTKAQLDSLGNFKESYDQVLKRILEIFEYKRANELLEEKTRG